MSNQGSFHLLMEQVIKLNEKEGKWGMKWEEKEQMNKKNEILAAQLGAQIRLSKFNEKVTQKIVDLEGKVEKQI